MKIGLLGLGTVGTGVAELLSRSGQNIAAKTGERIEIKKVLVKNPNKPRIIPPEMLTTNPGDILDDQDIDIVVEVMGGEEPALGYIKKALTRGKHVVTANKEVVARHGKQLLDLAARFQRHFLFEASVGGGIPIIKPLRESLAADEIEEITAIINGTTNYILSKMTEEGMGFGEVLQDAQAKGFAEADPSADLDGLDAGRKLAILSSLGFGAPISPDEIPTEGIRHITPKDVKYAKELGYLIKLLAWARRKGGQVAVRVAPALLPTKHPLASVHGVNNAILVTGAPVGPVMFLGQGAGKGPTASSVVGDIMEIVRLKDCPATFRPDFAGEVSLVKPADMISPFYVRLQAKRNPHVLADISSAFGEQEISLRSVAQKDHLGNLDILIITREAREAKVAQALRDCNAKGVTVGNFIRIMEVE